jgi:hypothetical protein
MSRKPIWLPKGHIPLQESTLPGRQVGEGLSPTLDAATFLIRNESFVKENGWPLSRVDSGAAWCDFTEWSVCDSEQSASCARCGRRVADSRSLINRKVAKCP